MRCPSLPTYTAGASCCGTSRRAEGGSYPQNSPPPPPPNLARSEWANSLGKNIKRGSRRAPQPFGKTPTAEDFTPQTAMCYPTHYHPSAAQRLGDSSTGECFTGWAVEGSVESEEVGPSVFSRFASWFFSAICAKMHVCEIVQKKLPRASNPSEKLNLCGGALLPSFRDLAPWRGGGPVRARRLHPRSPLLESACAAPQVLPCR